MKRKIEMKLNQGTGKLQFKRKFNNYLVIEFQFTISIVCLLFLGIFNGTLESFLYKKFQFLICIDEYTAPHVLSTNRGYCLCDIKGCDIR
jgi:hypothetical protein